MSRRLRGLLTVLMFCLPLGIVACGPGDDDDKEPAADAGTDGMTEDTGGDTSSMDTEEDTGTPECINDDGCDDGSTCQEGACVAKDCSSNDDCGGGLPVCGSSGKCVECGSTSDCSAPGQVCQDNSCQTGQCTSVGDTCDPSKEAGVDFGCVDDGTGPACLKTCNTDGSSGCPNSQICLPSSDEMGAQDVCFQSQCDGPADTEGCKDITSHPLFGSYDNGAKCALVSNGAKICVPAGEKKAGESCTATSPLFCEEGEPCEVCASGNTCIQGVCKPVCTGDEDCSGSNISCVGDEEGILGSEGAGFCEEECEAFSRGQCSGADQGCTALNNDIGYCRPTGDKGFMEACTPPSDEMPQALECQEGMDCLLFQAADSEAGRSAIHRCVPRCNPPSRDESNTADNDATCGGAMYGRFAHLKSAPATVDVYVDGTKVVEDLQAGGVSDADSNAMGSQFFELAPGEREVKVVDGSASDASNPLLTVKPLVESGQVKTWAITEGSNGTTIQTVDVPRGVAAPAMGSGRSMIRAVHQVPDVTAMGNPVTVDLVAVEQGDDLSSGALLAEDVDFGDAGAFVDVAGGVDYDLYVFENGATRTDGDELAKLTGITVTDETRWSLYLKGTLDSSDMEDVGVVAIPYSSAPEAPDLTCWTSSAEPDPASGLCFEECTVDDYGKGICDGTSNACSSRLGGHLCLPTGGKQTGDSCDSGAFEDCGGGSYCEQFGDGSGTCRSECVGGSSSNPALECESSTTCAADMGDFGECRIGCDPGDNNSDTNCPSNLQTCFPAQVTDGSAEGAWCSASDGKMEGDSCGGSGSGMLVQNCEAGLFCSYAAGDGRLISGNFARRTDEMAPDPTCRANCTPFGSGSSCGSGQACMPDTLVSGGSVSVGVCLDRAQSAQGKATGQPCDPADLGKMCGPSSMCLQAGQNSLCIEFCDLTTGDNSTCSGNTTCDTQILDGAINGVIGVCNPN